MKKNVNSYEVSLVYEGSDEGQTELLKDLLLGLGVGHHQITELFQNGKHCISVYFDTSTEGLILKRKLKKCNLQQVDIQSQMIKSKDWQNLWKKDFKPFQLTDRFDVVPFAYRSTHKSKKRLPIYIDTSFAFGTGLHATTRFMAQFVERSEGKYSSFLDIGTGTGILSILALKCGAEDVTAIDLTKEIIEITNTNFKENGFPHQRARALNFEKFVGSKKFDYVAANLITQDLITFGSKIVALVKKDQYLAVSGISLSNYPLLREKFKRFPLRCIKIEKGEGWAALLFKKTK